MELFRKYRPSLLKYVVGQKEAVDNIKEKLKANNIPHTTLFSGPSGCGKTTVARIVANKLECGPRDLYEVNAAKSRGIDDIRTIERQMYMAPIGGDIKVWIIDEAHQLTGEAQDAFLKPLEEPPNHVYFMLASSRPDKLKKTILSRCTEIKFNSILDDDMEKMILYVLEKEGKSVEDEVVHKIVRLAEGNARKALVLLEQIVDIEDADKQLETLSATQSEETSMELCRLLVNQRLTVRQWPEIMKLLKRIKQWSEAEEIRRGVLGYAFKAMHGKNAARCNLVIACFRDDLFASGTPGLANCCYDVLSAK